ncbi:methyltransferase family protein [Stella humosa]|uniref:Methyltransferase family protein n=1 Tax=Stella humosa TaxID=94 RepID=A0A3N1L5J8_9PROT|nr:methyltransferase domain-containing protein [Stella humosa]ROP84675.1 methyltransferase family protein [Stella humosa]BBK34195.1 methyltransferase [Stella humosa]
MATALDRIAFQAAQRLRRSWFRGHWIAAAALDRGRRPAASGAAGPGRRELDADLDALFAADWAAIEAGHYLPPADMWAPPARALGDSRAFLRDLPRVARRRREGRHQEVAADDAGTGLPRYYRQNFHFQTDGWLSRDSARLYDFQVEVLFGGAADAMRRGALAPLGQALTAAGAQARMVDLACGTGRFLAAVKDNWPRLAVTGIDLSRAYLDEAARRLRRRRGVTLVQALAERLPLADGSIDALTAIYLFHELPPGIRQAVAVEIARVLRPGGRLILVDSLQPGGHPPYDGLLERFPAMFHEPYFASWLDLDLEGLFVAAGLRAGPGERRFMSKIAVFDKPGA